jgi:phosphatidylserine decarboxylase
MADEASQGTSAGFLHPCDLHAFRRPVRWCGKNTKLISNLLFRCVSKTLLTIARDQKPAWYGLGFLGVLHT